MRTSAWLRPQRAGGRLRLFCLPYAGTGAAVFAGWQAQLPSWLTLVSVMLPGRESRIDEPAFSKVEDLVSPLADAVAPFVGEPYALLGCSMGALIAFELAHELAGRGLPEPTHLIGVSAAPPHRVPRRPPIAHLGDAELLAAIQARYGSITDDIIAAVEVHALIVPPLRADLTMFEQYAFPVGRTPLSCPVTAITGANDTLAPHQLLPGWGELTVGPFTPIVVPGGHFVARESSDRIIGPLLNGLLMPSRLAENALATTG